jgi:hypothetical protein
MKKYWPECSLKELQSLFESRVQIFKTAVRESDYERAERSAQYLIDLQRYTKIERNVALGEKMQDRITLLKAAYDRIFSLPTDETDF